MAKKTTTATKTAPATKAKRKAPAKAKAAPVEERVETRLPEPKALKPIVGEHYRFHAVTPATGRAKKPTPLPVFFGRVVDVAAKAAVVKVIAGGTIDGTRIVELAGLKLVPVTREQAFNPGDYR